MLNRSHAVVRRRRVAKSAGDDERAKVFPEWRVGLHSTGRRGLELFRAIGTDPAMQRYAYDIGFDVRDCDVIIGFAGSLRHAGNIHAAMPVRERQCECAAVADGERTPAYALRAGLSILIIMPVVFDGISRSHDETVESAIIKGIDTIAPCLRSRRKIVITQWNLDALVTLRWNCCGRSNLSSPDFMKL
jgi:hypothetical protein